MKCRFETIWLTGTPWQEDCGEVQWQAAQAIQQDALIRAATPFLAGRGNALDTIVVPIALQHASQIESLSHVANLPWTLPSQGLLYFEETVDGSTVMIFLKAAWQGIRRKRTGIASELEFIFIVTGPPNISTVAGPAALPGNIVLQQNGLPLLQQNGQFVTIT